MSISERERQALGLIEEDLAGSVPELAAKLAVFTRLTAGEAMPPRERVWRPAHTPSASPATVSGGQEASSRTAGRRRVRCHGRVTLRGLPRPEPAQAGAVHDAA